MKNKIPILLTLALIVLSLNSCKKEIYVYDVNTQVVEAVDLNKNRQKTPEQYISVLYANLFQKGLSANALVDISNVIQSIGDKQIAYEMLLSNFMNMTGLQIPSNEAMRADIPAFVRETYKRFYVRYPTQAELYWFVQFIENHPNLSSEVIFLSFALSNEYYFY